MKKTLLLGLLTLLYLYSAAQARFGATAGAVLANTNGASTGKTRPGVFLGTVMRVKLGKSASFRPQLTYILKGEGSGTGDKGSYSYLELPLNIVYNIPSKIGRFSLGGGPALAYMMGGSWQSADASKEKIYFDYDQVNQLDYGLNVLAGLEIKGGIFFTMNYTLGLQDVWQATHIGTNKNRALGLGVGMFF